jgi:hypothetical protein
MAENVAPLLQSPRRLALLQKFFRQTHETSHAKKQPLPRGLAVHHFWKTLFHQQVRSQKIRLVRFRFRMPRVLDHDPRRLLHPLLAEIFQNVFASLSREPPP